MKQASSLNRVLSGLQHRKPVVLCDFDGTITQKDVIVMALEAFVPAEQWQPLINAILQERMVSLKEGLQQLVALLPRACVPQLPHFVKSTVQFRAGFETFAEACQAASLPLLVVSGGVDALITPLIDPLQLPVFCNTLIVPENLDEPLSIAMPFVAKTPEACPACGGCAVCKVSVLNRYPEPDYFRLVIGDSLSDLGVAQQADWVFATGTLQQDLDALNVPYTPFTDFKTVQQALAPLLQQTAPLACQTSFSLPERLVELLPTEQIQR